MTSSRRLLKRIRLMFTETRLWRTSLAAVADEPETRAAARERLRRAFADFRERATPIAEGVARDMPNLTVHDITHMDALWEIADVISGQGYTLTPTEAFVLGGAFLIHDLANTRAAYPDSLDEMHCLPQYRDALTALLRARLGRAPTADELAAPDEGTRQQAVEQLLRDTHARHAEKIPGLYWVLPPTNEHFYLIPNEELRGWYGPIIGRIAYSHWWNVDDVGREFTTKMGAPSWCPNNWTVDPLKIACLLRAADACHLDSRRAPAFLRALRKPSGVSEQHWVFQGQLLQPRLDGERLEFTAPPFPVEQAESWWYCFDALRQADRELRKVDALLEASSPELRLAARRVAGVEEPQYLSKYVPTQDWIPLDARVHVSNVAALVRNLGGEQLYGADDTVPLRELIQNASDAVRARRLLEPGRGESWGDVTVRTGEDEHGRWLEVEDTGVGMSAAVLTSHLLDFGNSFWGTRQMREEWPGLQSSGFQPTGQYGIGFFSIFIWGQRVRVTTRVAKESSRTKILDFQSGVQARPLLRQAGEQERMLDPGTRVRVWFSSTPKWLPEADAEAALATLCARLCPSLDVNLFVHTPPRPPRRVLSASDWLTVDPEVLLERLSRYDDFDKIIDDEKESPLPAYMREVARATMRPLVTASGGMVGRAAILPVAEVRGVITVGGLKAEAIKDLVGIFPGLTKNATRHSAAPLVPREALAAWASEQADLLYQNCTYKNVMTEAAVIIDACGGRTGKLPLAISKRGYWGWEEIARWHKIPDTIYLTDNIAYSYDGRGTSRPLLALANNTLFIPQNNFILGGIVSLIQGWLREWYEDEQGFPSPAPGWRNYETKRVVLRAIAAGWGVSLQDLLSSSTPYSIDSGQIEVGKTTKQTDSHSAGEPYLAEADILRRPS
jgi:hypothetical protein